LTLDLSGRDVVVAGRVMESGEAVLNRLRAFAFEHRHVQNLAAESRRVDYVSVGPRDMSTTYGGNPITLARRMASSWRSPRWCRWPRTEPGGSCQDGSREIHLTRDLVVRKTLPMDKVVRSNRVAWEQASTKHVVEYDDLLEEARSGAQLFPREAELLQPLLDHQPTVVHFQSGHGLDDVALVKAGARQVVGVD
jgi:hypothetical protein